MKNLFTLMIVLSVIGCASTGRGAGVYYPPTQEQLKAEASAEQLDKFNSATWPLFMLFK